MNVENNADDSGDVTIDGLPWEAIGLSLWIKNEPEGKAVKRRDDSY